jgi:hypothetical protein
VKAASLRVIAAGSALLLTCLTAMAADRPTPYLKGVPTIEYDRFFDPTGPCSVDLKT